MYRKKKHSERSSICNCFDFYLVVSCLSHSNLYATVYVPKYVFNYFKVQSLCKINTVISALEELFASLNFLCILNLFHTNIPLVSASNNQWHYGNCHRNIASCRQLKYYLFLYCSCTAKTVVLKLHHRC